MARLIGTSRNLNAFLDMLAWSEGTAGIGDDGYNVLVCSRKTQAILFTNYAAHPMLYVRLRADDPKTPQNEELVSSAAGRYQILGRNFDAYKTQLRLPDFGPVSQDQIAVQMIRERGALASIEAGDLADAVKRCSNIWASLPGNNYGQFQQKLVDLRQRFTAAGGIAI